MQRRKGDITDITLLLVFLFFLAVSFVVVLYANTKIQSIISTTALNESAAYSSINESFDRINLFGVQRGFTILFGLLIIGIMASSFLIRVHPVFIFIYIITLGAAIFTAVYLGNTYELIVANPQFSAIAANYATITWVMQHVTKILLATGALSMIIILGKIGGGTSGQGDL